MKLDLSRLIGIAIGIFIVTASVTFFITSTQKKNRKIRERTEKQELKPTMRKWSVAEHPDGWQNFSLDEAGGILKAFQKDPSRYYGEFDLQEDMSVWSGREEADWTPIQWQMLINRYVARYPDQNFVQRNAKISPPLLTPKERTVVDRTRYRLVKMSDQSSRF